MTTFRCCMSIERFSHCRTKPNVSRRYLDPVGIVMSASKYVLHTSRLGDLQTVSTLPSPRSGLWSTESSVNPSRESWNNPKTRPKSKLDFQPLTIPLHSLSYISPRQQPLRVTPCPAHLNTHKPYASSPSRPASSGGAQLSPTLANVPVCTRKNKCTRTK